MRNRRILALLLLAALLTASCGSTAPASDTTAADTAAVSSDTTEEILTDSLPAGLDFGGKTIRFAVGGDNMKGAYNEVDVDEETGDVVEDAIYARNVKVEERLNVVIESIEIDPTTNTFMKNVRTTLMAGDDAYDIICGVQHQIMVHANEGLYYDLTDAPYLDYSKPWWYEDYMDTISINENVRYALSGELGIHQMLQTTAFYYNKELYTEAFGSTDDFYDLILDGGWTYDKLCELASAAYRDLNGDTQVNKGDRMGLIAALGSPTEHYAYTAGLSFTERDANGYPVLAPNQERNVKVFDGLYRLYYETKGTFISKDINAEAVEMFKNNEGLFLSHRILASDLYLRDMSAPYGIIPFPKLDDTQKEYKAFVHDSANLFSIPITSPDIEAQCAVLEAMCAESHNSVMPALYEVALKVKYTSDDVSAQVLDMIREAAVTDFIYANNYSFSGSGSLGTVSRTLMSEQSKDYMSKYATLEPTVKAAIASMIENFEAMNK